MAKYILDVIMILVTVAVALLSILLVSMRNWKKEFIDKLDKVCQANENEHKEIWDRVNHHWHNGGGNVVIPTPGGKRE